MATAVLEKHARVVGAQRATLAADLKRKYEDGASIRALAADMGRSYGFVYSILAQADVRMRPRGGNMRTTEGTR